MIISIDEEKVFDRIQHQFIKILSLKGIDGTYLNIVKAIYETPTASFILNGEKLKAFSSRSGTRQSVCFHFIFKVVLVVLATAIRQEELIKYTQIGKEQVKLLLIAHDMILYIDKPKYPT